MDLSFQRYLQARGARPKSRTITPREICELLQDILNDPTEAPAITSELRTRAEALVQSVELDEAAFREARNRFNSPRAGCIDLGDGIPWQHWLATARQRADESQIPRMTAFRCFFMLYISPRQQRPDAIP